MIPYAVQIQPHPIYNYFTEMCSGFEAGSYLRLVDFVYHSTLGLRVKKKKKKIYGAAREGYEPRHQTIPPSQVPPLPLPSKEGTT